MSAVEENVGTLTAEDVGELRFIINNGGADEQLDALGSAIDGRRRKLAEERRQALQVGDRVKLTKTVRPKYLHGYVATITKVRTSGRELVVDFGERIGRYGPVVELHRTMVEPVDG